MFPEAFYSPETRGQGTVAVDDFSEIFFSPHDDIIRRCGSHHLARTLLHARGYRVSTAATSEHGHGHATTIASNREASLDGKY